MSSSSNSVKNVAIVGAGGNSGKYMAEALLKTGQHVVTAITRPDSTSQFPEGLNVRKVDYNDHSSLVQALQGQDVLIVTMGVMAPKDQEAKLYEAAAEADVPWILPNEWGFDTTDDSLCKDVMIGESKKQSIARIEKLGKSSWIGISTGFWYEWSLAIPAAYGFDFAKREVTFFDDGETRINTSTWPQVGRTVASLLSLPVHADDKRASLDKYKNSHIYVSSFTISQKDMFESVLRVTKTRADDWKVTREPSHERYADGMEKVRTGDRMAFAKLLYSRVFYPYGCGLVEDTKGLANDALGLPKEDLDEFTEVAIERSKDSPWG